MLALFINVPFHNNIHNCDFTKCWHDKLTQQVKIPSDKLDHLRSKETNDSFELSAYLNKHALAHVFANTWEHA